MSLGAFSLYMAATPALVRSGLVLSFLYYGAMLATRAVHLAATRGTASDTDQKILAFETPLVLALLYCLAQEERGSST